MSDIIPVFSLVYTSARAQLIPKVLNTWNERSSLGLHEWCIGIDEDKPEVIAMARHQKDSNVKVIINQGEKTCVGGWNAAAEHSTGKIIIAVADDFVPPRNWDQELLALQPKGWEDAEHVVKVEDGYVHNIFVLSILTRKRYERFGYIFYPRYLSLFCDTEFGSVATKDGVVIEANHLLFEHMHPDCFKRQRDGVDMTHASSERWRAGEMLYNFRKAQGFPIDDGPMAEAYRKNKQLELQSMPVQTDKYVAYMQVTKDDLCLLAVCERLVEEGVKDFCFCQPDKYWSGEVVEPQGIADITEIANVLRSQGNTVHYISFNVDNYTMPGDTRILVETRIRNESLTRIRSLGYSHILIVDGDELWLNGTLDIVKSYVEQGHKAISVHMMPVIGVPGYPVEGAMDVAVVYIGEGVIFKVCRSPYIPQTIIYRPLIYHFTGTRKGMEETVKKHRRGGHYDDPDYLAEEWIDKVLPNIRPGFAHKWSTGHVGLHFYGPRQIWPKIRPWRAQELNQMPKSVLAYLGNLND